MFTQQQAPCRLLSSQRWQPAELQRMRRRAAWGGREAICAPHAQTKCPTFGAAYVQQPASLHPCCSFTLLLAQLRRSGDARGLVHLPPQLAQLRRCAAGPPPPATY